MVRKDFERVAVDGMKSAQRFGEIALREPGEVLSEGMRLFGGQLAQAELGGDGEELVGPMEKVSFVGAHAFLERFEACLFLRNVSRRVRLSMFLPTDGARCRGVKPCLGVIVLRVRLGCTGRSF